MEKEGANISHFTENKRFRQRTFETPSFTNVFFSRKMGVSQILFLYFFKVNNENTGEREKKLHALVPYLNSHDQNIITQCSCNFRYYLKRNEKKKCNLYIDFVCMVWIQKCLVFEMKKKKTYFINQKFHFQYHNFIDFFFVLICTNI